MHKKLIRDTKTKRLKQLILNNLGEIYPRHFLHRYQLKITGLRLYKSTFRYSVSVDVEVSGSFSCFGGYRDANDTSLGVRKRNNYVRSWFTSDAIRRKLGYILPKKYLNDVSISKIKYV